MVEDAWLIFPGWCFKAICTVRWWSLKSLKSRLKGINASSAMLSFEWLGFRPIWTIRRNFRLATIACFSTYRNFPSGFSEVACHNGSLVCSWRWRWVDSDWQKDFVMPNKSRTCLYIQWSKFRMKKSLNCWLSALGALLFIPRPLLTIHSSGENI